MLQNHLLRREIVGLTIVFYGFSSVARYSSLQEVEGNSVSPFIPYLQAAVLIGGVAKMLGAFGVLWRGELDEIHDLKPTIDFS